MGRRFFLINPGSTSTKLAVYEEDAEELSLSVKHLPEDLECFHKIYDQLDYRYRLIEKAIADYGIDLSSFAAVIARGGNMQPVPGGTYRVNDAMLADLEVGVMGQHASNLGGALARRLADKAGLEAYVVDPVVVDEFDDLARISGSPLIQRKSKDHPLNQRAVAREAAASLGLDYGSCNFIVAHMGGGISVGVHRKGRIVDVNNALNGDGPMSPERSGGLPFGSVIDLCFSGQYTKDQLMKNFVGKGGLTAYLGTNDAREVSRRIDDGDGYAERIYRAMAYQIAKEIGAAATVVNGQVDAICLTGGLAHDQRLMGWLKERIAFLAPVLIYPGEYEMVALARGVMRVLDGDEELQPYPPVR